QDWVLTLLPRKPELAMKVRDITLHGRGAELRCIETRTPDDPAPQRTLLAGAATAAAEIGDASRFAALCHGDSLERWPAPVPRRRDGWASRWPGSPCCCWPAGGSRRGSS